MNAYRHILAPILLLIVAGPVTGLLIAYAMSSYRKGHYLRASGTITALTVFNVVLLVLSYHLVKGHA